MREGKRGMGMDDFQAGRLAVGMELLTQMKVIRELPFTELTVELEAMIMGFLVDQRLIDDAELWYDKLDAWRSPKFSAVEVVASDVSSPAASDEGALARIRRTRASLEAHRGPDDGPSAA
jgi:hypothetical protein